MARQSLLWFLPCVLMVAVLASALTAADLAPQSLPANVGVSVSPHNLAFKGVTMPSGQVCLPCHTAHNAQAGQPALWNHQVNSGTTYALYNTSHPTRFGANYVGLDTASKLCLSCHDGAIAVDNFGDSTSGTHFVTGSQVVAPNGDLSRSHPVGLRYPGLNNGGVWMRVAGYNDPRSAAFSADGVDGNPGVQLVSLADGSLGVGCLSCHSTHNNTLGHFLRTNMQSSALCLKCHNS